MKPLKNNYKESLCELDTLFSYGKSFDLIKKRVTLSCGELTFYYIDGFIKDAVMSKLMMYLAGLKKEDIEKYKCDAKAFSDAHMMYVETEISKDISRLELSLFSGAAIVLSDIFEGEGIIVDARTYPARDTGEPEGDKVMRGARDGFVETLIYNTALIRRRVRDRGLIMHHISVGTSSKTDVVVSYIKGKADQKYVDNLIKEISNIKTESLTLGHESLAECLIRKKWYNPFPKIRYTERPDSAAAQLLEGSVLVLCDNSPEVMILPTSIFDFLQETNDFYFSPLTGTYIRVLRMVIFFLTLFLIPFWLLLVNNGELVPHWFEFIIPTEHGRIPIFVQILLAEFVIDGLRMASLNTPNMLSNSLSVVGGLILGDFAVSIGWLIPEVILYMAFVAIANFTQRSYELGYAFKFMRIILTLLTAFFDLFGFIFGCLLVLFFIGTNKTVGGKRRYLYPLIPFNGKALLSLFVRVKKRDVENKESESSNKTSRFERGDKSS